MNQTIFASNEPRKSRSLAMNLVDKLTIDVRDGTLRPGEKLPTEAEIMQGFGVSRTVVREAISKLQASGLVETRHGIGTFVLAQDISPVFKVSPSQLGTLREVITLLEFRISIETEAAALAALRRDDRNLEQMKKAMNEFALAINEGRDAALHVHCAAPHQNAIRERRLERRAGPGVGVTHGHDIGVPGEAEVGARRPSPGVEVFDLAELHPAADEAQTFQGLLDDIHRAEVGRRHRRTADQVAGKVENVDHGQSRSRSLIEVLERVWASTVLTITAQERLGPPCGSGRLPGTTTL